MRLISSDVDFKEALEIKDLLIWFHIDIELAPYMFHRFWTFLASRFYFDTRFYFVINIKDGTLNIEKFNDHLTDDDLENDKIISVYKIPEDIIQPCYRYTTYGHDIEYSEYIKLQLHEVMNYNEELDDVVKIFVEDYVSNFLVSQTGKRLDHYFNIKFYVFLNFYKGV